MPQEYVGPVMTLCNENVVPGQHAVHGPAGHAHLRPMAEVVMDFLTS